LLKEVIVVEGKDDMAAVKRACQAEVLITNGLGITKETLDLIAEAHKRCGVIILTDPDFPGEKIRRIIDEAVPGCRHAYLEQKKSGTKRGKVGVEYAKPQEILHSLKQARATETNRRASFSIEDLYQAGLVGDSRAVERREKLGFYLGVGKCNAKQLLNRLNGYGITPAEFAEALKALEEGRI
jgi:ribonuclease M5